MLNNKQSMIYLDNSATTPIDPVVLESYIQVSQRFIGNPSSLHRLGEESSKLLKTAREQIATLLKVKPDEIVFTSGGTEANNLSIRGTVWAKKEFGNHVITTETEHPASLKTIESLKAQGIIDVSYVKTLKDGTVDLSHLNELIRDDTILVVTMAVNNEVGFKQPLDKIADILEKHKNIHWFVDGVQSLGAFNSILPHKRIDFMSFSAHKFQGPRGVGFLYIKSGKRVASQLTGGGQELDLRSTTENLAGIVAMAKALRLHHTHGDALKLRLILKQYTDKIDNLIWLSPTDAVPYINCLALKNVRGEVLLHALEENDIFVSTISACSSRQRRPVSTLLKMGIDQHIAEGAIRLSFSDLTTEEEIHVVGKTLQEIAKHFKTVFRK
ncbi:cysteine desulfurase family protein [Atopobacter phocae]|uniref:cysteine desulfurase family protein n=1 Tax=Atopobacter phocae TaxID=136492 RepID=UPI0004AD7026|nr:cysteine desulfurase family protein [Atopobacter phocae]